MTTQRKERKKDISLYWSKLQVLQFYKFLVNSRIKDGVWYKLSFLKTLIFKNKDLCLLLLYVKQYHYGCKSMQKKTDTSEFISKFIMQLEIEV